jgi:hypothetical protein
MRYALRLILVLLLFILVLPHEGMSFRAFSGESSETSQTEGKNESARDEYGIRISQPSQNTILRRTKRPTQSESLHPEGAYGEDGFRLKNCISSPNIIIIENPRYFSAAILRI